MSNLLYVQTSPRGERSDSIAVADAFVDAYAAAHPGDGVSRINLFERDLMPFDGLALQAKYTVLHGAGPTGAEKDAWAAVEAVIEEFASADRYVFAVPMWNFSIPYRLKQYVDIIVQPGYTFAVDEQGGYTGLLTGKRAFVAYARGGVYSPEAGTAAFDMQKPYFEMILGFMGIADVQSVIAAPMLMGGPEAAAAAREAAVASAREAATEF